MTSNEVDQVLWNREKRCVRAIDGVNQVLRILTPYEVRLLMMKLLYYTVAI